MKNKNEEEYDDRMLIGYSRCVRCEREGKKRKKNRFFFSSVEFFLWYPLIDIMGRFV
jgi:hypothetical protein